MKLDLTKQEREILILGIKCQDNKHLSIPDIAKFLDLPVSTVKAAIHRACTKLGAGNRYEAAVISLLKGEIGLNEVFSDYEIAEILSSIDPEMQRKTLRLLQQWLEHGYITMEDMQTTHNGKRHDAVLTKSEREVVLFIGWGLSNSDIADRLCISTSAVRTFIYRACVKLGVNRRSDLFWLARKKGEIDAFDLIPPNKLIGVLKTMGATKVKEVARLLEQKLEQNAVNT